MADPVGVLSGFVGVCIDLTVHGILHQINIAVRCKKELNSLGDLVKIIEPIISQIQQYRLALNKKKGIPNKASVVNQWLQNMDALLKEGLAMAQECTIQRCNFISRYQTSRRITRLISDINQLLDRATLMSWASDLEEFGWSNESVKEELVEIKESVQAWASSQAASTSATTSQTVIASTGFFIKEPLIVGQQNDLARLEKSVIDEAAKSPFLRIGLVGKGGSGKTLLMKTLFNSQKVRDFFSNGLLLWLTVSQSPSFTSLRNELSAQIAAQTKADLEKNINQEAAQIWLHERMQEARFVLMLDDVWEDGAQLLEELGLPRLNNPSNSTVIVSSRNRRTLLKMGIAKNSIIPIGDLDKDDSWRLFACHAFPYDGKIPASIYEETAVLVCARCGGLPLAIKAVGRAMAGTTDAYEWDLAARNLPTADRREKEAVYDRLRLSYDALGGYDVKLQMCFLYLAAFLEDEMVQVESEAIPLWTGEGLLDKCGQDPFEMGIIYVKALEDRCLIEPILRDVDGRVLSFRMHDVLRDLAIQIAEHEENFYCRTGQGLTMLNEDACSGRTRILLNNNNLTSLPQPWSASQICSLTLRENNITEIPRRLLEGMPSLKILDLSGTSLKSLPQSVGCLTQLVYLNLAFMPITMLPPSFTSLVNLQILILFRSTITKLPSDIYKLRSLKCLDCLPDSISGLTSLQHFDMSCCTSLWTEQEEAVSIKALDLGNLAQLKTLRLSDNGQTISEGTLGKFVHMETLFLNLATVTDFTHDLSNMSNLTDFTHDLSNMSNLRRLALDCPCLVKIAESNFCEFRRLTHLRMWNCYTLEELPALHKFQSLKQLDIVSCRNLKSLPKEFSENGAFPKLEILSLVELLKLEELPKMEEGAMASLQILTVMRCEKIKNCPKVI